MNKREHVVKVDETFGQGQWDLALKKVYVSPSPYVCQTLQRDGTVRTAGAWHRP